MASPAVRLHLPRSPSSSESRGASLLPSPTSFYSSPSNGGVADASPTKSTHTCPSCSRTFSRGEHLDRHLTTHLPSNTSKTFICPSCSKGFRRKDVLTRHVRAVHETKRLEVRKSRRRSCRRCAGFKIKCTGGGRGTAKDGTREGGRTDDPCEVCKKRGAVCIYDFGTTIGGSEDRESRGGKKLGKGDNRGSDVLRSGDKAYGGGSDSDTGASKSASRPKRRKTLDGSYTTESSGWSQNETFYSPLPRVSPHLLSAARLASSQSASPERSLEAPTNSPLSAVSLRNLINPSESAELAEADQLISIMTTNTYGQMPTGAALSSSSDNSRLGGQGRTSPGMGSLLGARSQNRPLAQPAAGDLFQGRMAYYQSQPPLSFRDAMPEPARPEEFHRDNLAARELPGIAEEDLHAANTLQRIRPVPHSPSYGTQTVGDISTFINGVSPILSGAGPSQILNPINQRHDSGYGDGLQSLEADSDWIFDLDMFDKSTDWLRGWGDDSALPKEGPVGSCALSDLSIPSSNSTKQVPSPVSACSEDGSVFTLRRREDHQTRLPLVSPIKDHSSVEDFLPWGWQSSRGKPGGRVTLPPLRQVLEEYTSTVAPHQKPGEEVSLVNERIRSDMVSLLSIPCERYPYESADMSKFPSKMMIDLFIKIYFEQFNQILPMIHKPTFSTETCPTIVLVAMASIGASYSHVEGAKVFADTLSELCKRTLSWMAEFNPEYPRSDFFLMASCLQNVYALGSGSHRLYDCADVSRSALIGSARRIGLFSGHVSPPSSLPSSPPGSPSSSQSGGASKSHRGEDARDRAGDMETRWHTWRKKEELKRLAWSIFEYDCSFSTLSNRRGAITLNDISTRMPCAEALWEAPTAQAWNALLESGVFPLSAEKGSEFYPTLRDVISGKMSPEALTSWGRRLCAQAMGRILWDFKELEESVLSSPGDPNSGNGGGLGLPMLSPGLKPAKETLLRSLMVICDGVRERQMEGGRRDGEVDGDRAHMILALLISHYTHLHAAFPTVSLILCLARRPPPPRATPVDPRITRLENIFSADPICARTLAWNAAQIIAISRWKPVCSPTEGMRLFMAGIVLWGFGRYFREAPLSSPPAGPAPSSSSPLLGVQEEVVRLDSRPWKGVDDWIKKGRGKATIGNDQHSPNAMTEICSEMGAREVLRVVVGILGRMRAWGLGGEFKNVLEEMVRRS